MITSSQLAHGLLRAAQKYPKKIDELVRNFMSLCHTHHLMSFVPLVVRHLDREQQRQTRAQTATITLAREHGNDVVSALRRAFDVEQDSPESTQQDQKLIGGFVMRYRDTVWDGSVKGQLRKLKNILTT